MIEFIRKGVKEGFSARAIILFAMLVIMVLHILIGASVIATNHLRDGLDEMTARTATVNDCFGTLIQSTDTLADNARLYVLTGDTVCLDKYTEMYADAMKSADALLAMLSEEELVLIQRSAESGLAALSERTERECRAVLLSAAARGEDLSAWELFLTFALTEEEQALTPEAQQAEAEALLADEVYRSEGVSLSNNAHRDQMRVDALNKNTSTARSRLVRLLRRIMLIFSIAVVLILAVMCAMLFRLMVLPLEEFIHKVRESERLPEWKGMLELRQLSRIYNKVIHAQKLMEGNLRSLSLTDALTNLPNRLAFENYMNKLRMERPEVSLTVFSLDVNGLKQINDTLGHVYGDELLRKSADCILESFSDRSGKNCFRFGGDEFAAFWVDTPLSEIEPTLERFAQAQQVRGVSIAVGYAHTDRLGDTTVDELYEQADEEMYRRKAAHKKAERDKLEKLD